MIVDTAEIDQRNREAWNGAHRAHHEGALSGSHPIGVLHHHELCDRIQAGLIVLDIGLGLGGMARCLSGCSCIVDCLDVADAAAETVAGFARNFYLASRIEELPNNEYDLAISMIVAQHMCERNLRSQIQYVFRALKPCGVFALHLAGATEGPLNNLTCEIPSGMDGAMCRTPEYAIAMIDDVLAGQARRITLLDHRMEWPQFKSYWYFVHIMKE